MAEIVQHKHIKIRAELSFFFDKKDGRALDKWVTDLIDKLGMQLMIGPFSIYLERAGLRGWTSLTGIETSHISLHVWDEPDPIVLQFDVYTCGDMNKSVVLEHLRPFGPKKIVYKIEDRADGFIPLDEGIIYGAI